MRLELLVLMLSLGVGPLAALASAKPGDEGPWVMVVPPWRNAEVLANTAKARLVGPVSAPLGHLVTAKDAGAVQRLADAGAWFVLDAGTVLQLCGVEE